jgi:hypothetical protein
MVSRVTLGELSVKTLAEYVEAGAGQGAYSLGIDTSMMKGQCVSENYRSALEAKDGVTKQLKKRCDRGQTLGPYRIEDLKQLGIADLACNSIGAVSKKDTTDMRPVDDMHCNRAIKPPKFGMCSLQVLREDATPGCWWWTVDVEDAFANVPLGSADRPFMLFRWYHTDDTNFEGDSHDYVYLHIKGNFGPRPLPYIYTMIQLYVNIAAICVGVTPPPMGYIDDNTATRAVYLDSFESLQLYRAHLRMAGLPDKPTKEKGPFQYGVILGRFFSSIDMTISMPPDKVRLLESMFLFASAPGSKMSLGGLESMVGYWEFCLECLPSCLKGFVHNTHAWMKGMKRSHTPKHLLRFVPRKVKRDMQLMMLVTPMCNGTQPLQPCRGKDWSRPLMTDACNTGGGYCTPTMAYARKFTCRERKYIIALKEALMVREAVEHNAPDWEGTVLPIYVDNTTAMWAFMNGRSKNTKLNEIVRTTLIALAQHEITPLFYYVSTHMNTLADCLSRGWYKQYATHIKDFVWPDEHKPMGAKPKVVNFALPDLIEADIEHYKAQAFEKTSVTTWNSGWNAFLQYCEEAKVDPYGTYDTTDWDHVMAGFKARLGLGHYGRGKEKQTNTIISYTAAVTHFRDEYFSEHLQGWVMRGIKKEKGVSFRVKRTVTLNMSIDLMVQAQGKGLDKLRNAVAYAHLGQGLCRAQAAVTSTIAWWEMDRALTAADVMVDRERYAVGFALKHSKNDPFHENASKDDEKGRDWVWCSGTPDCILDIVPLVIEYQLRMGFDKLSPRQLERIPFYQEISGIRNGKSSHISYDVKRGQPTGRPLTYKRLLEEWRADLDSLPSLHYPVLDSKEWGLHSWRRYGATVAKCRGVPNDIIRRIGRWRSDTFELYFTLTSDDEIAMQRQVLQGCEVIAASPNPGSGGVRSDRGDAATMPLGDPRAWQQVEVGSSSPILVPEAPSDSGGTAGGRAGSWRSAHSRQRPGVRTSRHPVPRGNRKDNRSKKNDGCVVSRVAGIDVLVRQRGHVPRTTQEHETRVKPRL